MRKGCEHGLRSRPHFRYPGGQTTASLRPRCAVDAHPVAPLRCDGCVLDAGGRPAGSKRAFQARIVNRSSQPWALPCRPGPGSSRAKFSGPGRGRESERPHGNRREYPHLSGGSGANRQFRVLRLLLQLFSVSSRTRGDCPSCRRATLGAVVSSARFLSCKLGDATGFFCVASEKRQAFRPPCGGHSQVSTQRLGD